MARLLKKEYPLPAFNWMEKNEGPCPHDTMFAELEHNSDRLIAKGITEGAIWKTQIADGYAYYLVVKSAPLTLQWIPYGDAWQAPAPLIRGLRLSDVQAQHNFERLIRRM